MKEALYILVPLVIIIVNEYHKNKIFNFFNNFYYYSKYILLLLPFVLIYLNPKLLKKILVFYKDIDNTDVPNRDVLIYLNHIESMLVSNDIEGDINRSDWVKQVGKRIIEVKADIKSSEKADG